MKKWMLLLLLTAVFLTLLMTPAVCETSGTCGDNLTWTLDSEGILNISGTGNMDNYFWGNYSPWYSEANNIKSVVIENGVASIGDYAFLFCNLEYVSIPDTVISIGTGAFQLCMRLIEVTIPRTVSSIGSYAFSNCFALQAITVAADNSTYMSVEGILFNKQQTTLIFYPKKKTGASYTVPDGVTVIGSESMCNDYLTSITIPESVVQIASDAFATTVSLAEFFVASDNPVYTSIEGALFNKAETMLIRCPEGIRTSLYIVPETVTNIGDLAFFGCDFLQTIYISTGVTEIGERAFDACDSSMIIEYTGTEAAWDQINIPDRNEEYFRNLKVHFALNNNSTGGTCGYNLIWVLDDYGTLTISGTGAMLDYDYPYFNEKTGQISDTTEPWYRIREYITKVVIESGVTTIGAYAFSECSAITSVEIPDTVTSIGDFAFENCTALADITIPESVISIGIASFNLCNSLTSMNIPSGVVSIGNGAFYSSEGLVSVTIPDSVTSIGIQAFEGCSNLTNITVAADNQSYSSLEGVLFNKNRTVLIRYPAGKTSASYTVPNGVICIDDNAFVGSFDLASITLPDSLNIINYAAFTYCTSLTDVIIPGSVTSIGEYAFTGCNELSSVTILEGVSGIGNYAFTYCYSLTNIVIPSSVVEIGYDIFYGCESVTLMDCESGSAAHAYAVNNDIPFVLKSVLNFRLPAQTACIESEAFANIPGLTGVYIPAGCTDIAADAFGDAQIVIYGPAGSYAETFAGQHGYAFVEME